MPKRHHKFFTIFSILLIASAGFGGFFIALNYLSINKIYPGIKVANVRLSGLKPETAEIFLDKKIKESFGQKDFIFILQNNAYPEKIENLGIKIDAKKTIEQIFLIGRNKNLIANLAQQTKALWGAYNLPVYFDFDEPKFNNWINKTFRNIENPAQNANLIYNKKEDNFYTSKSKKGIVIDRANLKKELFANIKNLSNQTIKLSLIEDFPEIEAAETDEAKNKAGAILKNAPYEIKYKDKEWNIEKNQVAEWLKFLPKEDPQKPKNKILGINFDKDLIKQYVISLSPSINKQPVNAVLQVENNRVSAFALDEEGIEILIEENVELIVNHLASATLSVASAGTNPIELLAKITPPQITMESISELGLTSLIGRGESDFSGSPTSRIHNIKTGAGKFNGILIKAGEEFSFNKLLGGVGPKEGYLPAFVIKQGKTILEYGGGLCQVSTTVFRAAINSGFKITERYPHAYPVKYYNPQGFDATIYAPHPDLRFINNTPSYILIQSKINGAKLTFEIYGTDDGREVKIDGPHEYDKKSDGSLKAVLKQEVRIDGKLIEEKTFYSSYKSPSLYPVERNPLE